MKCYNLIEMNTLAMLKPVKMAHILKIKPDRYYYVHLINS